MSRKKGVIIVNRRGDRRWCGVNGGGVIGMGEGVYRGQWKAKDRTLQNQLEKKQKRKSRGRVFSNLYGK